MNEPWPAVLNDISDLSVTSLCWMETRMVGMDGKPATTILLEDGYFEIPSPKAFFADNPKSKMAN
jgi:hypothetical protein